MKTKFKLSNRILSLVLTFVMVVSMMPASALSVFAVGGDPVCDCGTDDALIHATTCAVYVAPETAVCYCTEKCSDTNIWCDVCGFDCSKCGGTDTAVVYELAENAPTTLQIGTTFVISDGVLGTTTGEGWSYDINTNTLTLNNANITEYNNDTNLAGVYYKDGDLTIEVIGNNTITYGILGDSYPVSAYTLVIRGFGAETSSITMPGGIFAFGPKVYISNVTLTIEDHEYSCIQVYDILDITGCYITVKAIDDIAAIACLGVGDINVTDSYVYAYTDHDTSIDTTGSFTAQNSHFVVSPIGPRYTSDSYTWENCIVEGDHLLGAEVIDDVDITVYGYATLRAPVTVANGEIINFVDGSYINNLELLTVEEGITVLIGGVEHTHETYGPVTYEKLDDDAHTVLTVCEGCPVGYIGKATENHSTTDEGDRAATCKELAYCSVCQSEYGEVGGHTPAENATYTDNGDGTHSFTCTVCQTAVTEDHTLTDGACTACDYVCPHSNFDSATGNCTDCETSLAIAKIKTGENTIYYRTADDLRTAVLENTDDQTITLLADFAIIEDLYFNAGGTENTLDLNGHTLICSDPISERILLGDCELAITGTGSINIFMGADSEGSKIVVGSGVTLNNSLRSAYGGVLDLTNATIPEAGLNVILYSDDWDPTTYNVSDVLLLPADYYFFMDGKAVYTYSGETEGTVLKHTDHSYTYTDNGDGMHAATCSVCGITVTENHDYDNYICTICGNPVAQITGTAVNDDFSVTFFVEHDDNYLPWDALQFVVYNGDQIVPLDINYVGVERPYATMTGLNPDCKGITLTAEIVISSFHTDHEKTIATVEVKNPDNHPLTYYANGNVITASCSKCNVTLGTATITAENTIYDGTAQETANVAYSDGWTGGELTISYENNVNAGTATASITIGDATATVDFTIAPAILEIEANDQSKTYGEADPLLTYDVSGLANSDNLIDVLTGELTREAGENAGTYAITQGTLTANSNYTIAFTGAEFTIIDKTVPTGTILIKENGWNKFWNTITFGIFCKDYVDVTITADGTGSGVAKVEYLLSGTALEENNIPADGWTTLNADNGSYRFSIQPQSKVAVYVRITDEGGNVTVINSDGIVVYEDSEAVDTEVTYTYKENSNKDIVVKFNGNTVKSIACSEKVLVASTDYSVDYESGKIVLKSTYLDTLSAGNYTFTVSYNPMGVENSGVTDLTTTFSVHVKPIGIDGATVTVNDTFTFDNNAKTPDPVVVLNGKALVKGQDYTVSYAENVNAGTATVTVTGIGNYSGTASGSFVIKRAELTNVSVQQNGKLTYDGGNALTPAVTENATALNGAKIYFLYCADGNNYGEMPTFTDAGTYTVYYCVYTVDSNFYDVYNSFTVTIDKATVTEPTIASKPYDGSVQTADISDTDLYTVVQNNGGTEKGSYDVVLKLKDSANYKWSTTDNEEVTVQFVISAAQNVWNTKPSISGWTYGQSANEPVFAAKYGAVKVTYTGKANDGTDYNSEAAPTKAGNYTATFTVEGTEDYSGLSEQVNFTIAKKAVTVTAIDASKTYGDSDPALTYTHTELIGSDALFITVARASGEDANTYTITASQAEGANPNYEITFKTGTFTINKAALTVTVEDKTATYGDAVPNYTVKYDGFVSGDDKADLGGTLAFDCAYAQFDDKGEYTIKASGYTSGNYTITYVDGKLTVNAKPITVTVQNATSIYGDALAELKATDNGIVNGDANVYSIATTATSTSNVGKYAITGTALDSNYEVTFVNGEYEITKREITITVDAKNAVVNTALPTYTYKVEGLVGEDKLVTEPTLTCNANIAVIGEYDITATGADAGGNYSIKYVPAKLSILTDNAVDAAAGYTEELKDYDPATVTSEDKAALDEILDEINTILDDENITDNGKKALEEVKEKVENLIKEINDAAEATDTENVGKVENVTPENVTPENKTDLEGAKADLEKALEDHGSNMTEDEKKAVEDEIKRIDDALEVIGNVEAVEEAVSKLPAVDTVKPDDEEAIKAITDAQTAYNALSDYEKSLVDEATKETLDKLAAALVAYDIVEGDGSSWTEDSDHNITFVVNGLFSKFVGIKVDGKDVDKANYEAKAGSTIITLKASYLDTLAVGEHTITVVYTDGSTDGAFKVIAKSSTPATGDDFNIALYGSLMVVSVTALVVLLLASKKKKYAK